jgi:hypothetical protein
MIDPNGRVRPASAGIPAIAQMPQWWLWPIADQMPSEASIPLEHIRRLRDPLIWKLEAALKC